MSEPSAHAQMLLDLTHRLRADADVAEAYLARRELLPPALLEEQTRLANVYRAEMTRLKASPELLQGAAPHLVEGLMAAGAQLRAVLDRRQRALASLKAISEGLAEAMAEEAARQVSPPTAYGEQGLLAGQNRPSPAVAVDRRA